MSNGHDIDEFLAGIEDVLAAQHDNTTGHDGTGHRDTTVPDRTRADEQPPDAATGPGRVVTLRRPLEGPRDIDELTDTPRDTTPRQDERHDTATGQDETSGHDAGRDTATDSKRDTPKRKSRRAEEAPTEGPEEDEGDTDPDAAEQDTKTRARSIFARGIFGDGPTKAAEALAAAVHKRGQKSFTKDRGDVESRLRARWAAVTTERAGRIRWAGLLFTGSAALCGWHIGLTTQISSILATAEAEIPSEGGHYIIAAAVLAAAWSIDRAVSSKVLPLAWLGRVALVSAVISIALTV